MTTVVIGLLALFAAAGIIILIVAAPRQTVTATGAGTDRFRELRDRAFRRADAAMKKRDPHTVSDLELAGMRVSAGTVVLVLAVIAAGASALGIIVALARPSLIAWLLPLLFPLAILLGARLLLSHRIESRRRAFADQLEGTLQLLASGLRAGHSLQRAMDSVSRDSDSPTAEEFTRAVNEHRLGRDLSDALTGISDRMKSDDMAWTAQAVAIHREVGGNLSELLDHVAETIRERQQIRRQIATLSSEGRVSAVVLMVLPVGIALLLSVLSPGYLAMFVTTPLGFVLLAVCLVLFVSGSLWLRAITKIEF